MKKTNYIFVILLFIALAIFLSSCNNSICETYIESTTTSEQYIENEDNNFSIAEPEISEPQTVIETKPQLFDENITFDINYINDGKVMPYALLTPSSATDDTPIPLIVWLHRTNEQNISEEDFLNKGLTKIIADWDLMNFNAYIICPQMKGSYYSDFWCVPNTEQNLENLLDKFISEHNIDQNKIIISGASLGGQGALYLSVTMADYFDRAVVFSAYGSKIQCSDIEIPVIGYIGSSGENPEVVRYMRYFFGPEVNCHLKTTEASRTELPRVAFNLDRDENGKSDIVEWMFSD